MSKDSPKKIVDISFRKDGRIHEFYTGNFVLNKGDKVIVEAIEGVEMGTVCSKPRLRDASMPDRPIKKIFRLATAEDIEKKKKNERIEEERRRPAPQVHHPDHDPGADHRFDGFHPPRVLHDRPPE